MFHSLKYNKTFCCTCNSERGTLHRRQKQ